MTGPEMRARMEALGYATSAERADALDLDRGECHNMEKGKRRVSKYATARVELLECRARLTT